MSSYYQDFVDALYDNSVDEFLENYSIDRKARGPDGETILHAAISRANFSVMKRLVDDYLLSQVDFDGQTALHYAYQKGFTGMVAYLESKMTPADIERIDFRDKKARDYARPRWCSGSLGIDLIANGVYSPVDQEFLPPKSIIIGDESSNLAYMQRLLSYSRTRIKLSEDSTVSFKEMPASRQVTGINVVGKSTLSPSVTEDAHNYLGSTSSFRPAL